MLRSIFGWGALLWVGSVQATWTAITTPLSEIASDYEEYSVAINDEGQVIASFGGELFGRCDVQGGQWNFTSFEELRTRYCRENEQEPPEKEKEFSIDKGLYVSINNKGEGFVLFRVPYGQDQDDLAVVAYSQGQWKGLSILSTAKVTKAVLAQLPNGKAIAAWVEVEETTERLMIAFCHNGAWQLYGELPFPSEFDNKQIHDIKVAAVGEYGVFLASKASSQDVQEVNVLIGHYLDVEDDISVIPHQGLRIKNIEMRKKCF